MKTSTFLFADFLAYVRNPQYTLIEQPDGPWRDRIRLMWHLWRSKALVGFSLAILMTLVQQLAKKATGLEFEHNIHAKGWSLILALVVMAPLMEEGLFRGLLKPRAGQLAVVMFLVMVYLVRYTYGHWAISKLIEVPVAMVILVGLPALTYFYLRKPRHLAQIERFWKANFRLIFYIVAISFGVVHVSNYEHLTVWHYLIAPFLVLPQLFAGFYLGYVRMRYGIWYGIALHAIWNAVPASMTVAYLLIH